MTQSTVAKRAGVGRTTITNVESGNQTVSLELLYRLAAAIEVPPKDLLPSGQMEAELVDERTKTLPEWDRVFVARIAALTAPLTSRQRSTSTSPRRRKG